MGRYKNVGKKDHRKDSATATRTGEHHRHHAAKPFKGGRGGTPVHADSPVTGLRNFGNTCYANAVFQALRFVPLVDPAAVSAASASGDGEESLRFVKKFLEFQGNARCDASVANSVRAAIATVNRRFASGQNDAQEFLSAFVQYLHCSLKRRYSTVAATTAEAGSGGKDDDRASSNSHDEGGSEVNGDAADAVEPGYLTIDGQRRGETVQEARQRWLLALKHSDDSCVMDAAGGMAQSATICPRCHHMSLSFEPFIDLVLQFPDELLLKLAGIAHEEEGDATSRNLKGNAKRRYERTVMQEQTRKANEACTAFKSVRLADMIRNTYARVDSIEDYRCERCNASKVKKAKKATCDAKAVTCTAERRLTFAELPPYLIVTVKRFSPLSENKINVPVKFPLHMTLKEGDATIPDHLRLGKMATVVPSATARQPQRKARGQLRQRVRYTLVATVTHHGDTIGAGHYTANVRHFIPPPQQYEKDGEACHKKALPGPDNAGSDGAEKDESCDECTSSDGESVVSSCSSASSRASERAKSSVADAGTWYHCDDSRVITTTLGAVLDDPDVYMLVYMNPKLKYLRNRCTRKPERLNVVPSAANKEAKKGGDPKTNDDGGEPDVATEEPQAGSGNNGKETEEDEEEGKLEKQRANASSGKAPARGKKDCTVDGDEST